MREADLTLSRRNFLLTSVKAAGVVAGGLVVGPEVFEMLDQLGPRRLLVPGYAPFVYRNDLWRTIQVEMAEVYLAMTDTITWDSLP